jgi:hypothetical protein
MLDAINALNVYEKVFVGYPGLTFVITLVGIGMLRHYAKKN